MTQRVTIDINSNVLTQAQRYVSKKGSSLSSFIEALLCKNVPCDGDKVQEASVHRGVTISPFVASLGVDMNLPADFEEKAAYDEYLASKHS